jgi:two-component system chemotaxis response regulator CheB
MIKNKVRLLVVDDSAVFCRAVKKHFEDSERIEVCGTAADAFEAKERINELKPDVLILDVELPRMNGLQFLTQLMEQYPMPCIMVTAYDTVSETEALSAGAAAFMLKPKTNAELSTFFNVMGTKAIVASAHKARFVKKPAGVQVDGVSPVSSVSGTGGKLMKVDPVLPTAMDISGAAAKGRDGYIVALGASTGGTDALECIIKSFPANMPPVVVVQHMPPVFTRMYAERLDKSCAMKVKEAKDGDRLKCGECIIGAGGYHLEVKKDAAGYYVKSYTGEKVSGHCPSVDVLFASVADAAGAKAVGAIMTGMGADGAKGLLKMHGKGAYTIGQNKETCVVYGMPMEAYKLGACSEQQPLERIGAEICHRLCVGWNYQIKK